MAFQVDRIGNRLNIIGESKILYVTRFKPSQGLSSRLFLASPIGFTDVATEYRPAIAGIFRALPLQIGLYK